MKKILITGGCGFIGSHFVNLVDRSNEYDLIVIADKMTYAAINKSHCNIDDDKIIFERVALEDLLSLNNLFQKYHGFNHIVNIAAESHVDNSIESSYEFIDSNIKGTNNLLLCAKNMWDMYPEMEKRFLQVSTDEVYGSNDVMCQRFKEEQPLSPSSPYSASKASADLLVQAFIKTHNFPAVITRCTNNYGPRQHTEKLIPKVIERAFNNVPIPVYGNGLQIRDWIHVKDHCRGIFAALKSGDVGEVYNIAGYNEKTNMQVIKQILDILDKPYTLIEYVDDRKAHDYRYAVDMWKLSSKTSFVTEIDFNVGLKETVDFYACMI